ncbi:MAG: DedA family protein [Candidatus Krumholzibacteriaceae bacterium]|jgi:membrane protein DedA with SNARE-associated domain
MGLTEFIVRYATLVIEKTGYAGIGILMTMESMIMPVPSEAVMPFAGFLWFEHKLSFWGIVLASTTGSIIGSLISYCIGAYGGRPFVRKYGRYFLLNEHHLDRTENFFSRHGEITIFISRFIPVVRHLISIPAGLGRMNIVRFSIYTVVGAGLWNSFLTWLGYHLRDNWETVRQYTQVIDIVLVAALLAAAVFFAYKQIQSMRRL